MSLNKAHDDFGRALLYQGESVLTYCDGVKMSLSSSGPGRSQAAALNGRDKKGQVYLTTHRVIFINEQIGDPVISFSFSFFALRKVKLMQAPFGADYLRGRVISEPDGNWEGEAVFELHFKSNSAITAEGFGVALLNATQMASRHYVNNGPPQFNSTCGSGQASLPPFSSSGPWSPNMSWIPETNIFPSHPRRRRYRFYFIPIILPF